jgi:hypothetical protein
VNVKFNKSWQGYIYAAIEGCSLLQDSVKVFVSEAPSLVSLGTDTVICPGNSITLNAHGGFLFYKWQDGATDSIYKVTRAGRYFVTATNACGENFTDTVIVSAYPPITFNAGPDIILCKGDTAIINAPAGFINYQWLPPYNIADI